MEEFLIGRHNLFAIKVSVAVFTHWFGHCFTVFCDIQNSVQLCLNLISWLQNHVYHLYLIHILQYLGTVCDLLLYAFYYRSLCLSTDEAFEQGKSLPFINPSSLETLRALVQEIQSSGETDPEIWKDCEVGKYHQWLLWNVELKV